MEEKNNKSKKVFGESFWLKVKLAKDIISVLHYKGTGLLLVGAMAGATIISLNSGNVNERPSDGAKKQVISDAEVETNAYLANDGIKKAAAALALGWTDVFNSFAPILEKIEFPFGPFDGAAGNESMEASVSTNGGIDSFDFYKSSDKILKNKENLSEKKITFAKEEVSRAYEHVNVRQSDTVADIAKKWLNVDPFISLALMVEHAPTTPYIDAAGVNVGAGYCVTVRQKAHGATRVKEDLLSAGFTPAEVGIIMAGKRQELKKVDVSLEKSVKLLLRTKSEYKAAAKSAVGDDVFNSLGQNQKAALAYLSYNTGSIHKFKKLVSALRTGDITEALKNMTPKFKQAQGKWQPNHRLGAWVKATFLGTPLESALGDPHLFEKSYAHAKGNNLLKEHNKEIIKELKRDQEKSLKTSIAAKLPSESSQIDKTSKSDKWSYESIEALLIAKAHFINNEQHGLESKKNNNEQETSVNSVVRSKQNRDTSNKQKADGFAQDPLGHLIVKKLQEQRLETKQVAKKHSPKKMVASNK